MLSLQHARIAILGAGAVGIITAGQAALQHPHSAIDVFDPHPQPALGQQLHHTSRITRPLPHDLVHALDFPAVRFFGNVAYGLDLTLTDLTQRYDAIIFTPNSNYDQQNLIRGIDLPDVFDGTQFLRWHAGQLCPDIPWALKAPEVAVLGATDSALAIATILASQAAENGSRPMITRCLHHNHTKQIHLITPDTPAEVQLSLPALQRFAAQPHIDFRVEPCGFENSRTQNTVDVRTTHEVPNLLRNLVNAPLTGAPISVRMHLCHRPSYITGQVQVTGLHTERRQPADCEPNMATLHAPSTEQHQFNVQAVYSTQTPRPAPIPGLTYDYATRTIPTRNGRVYNGDGGYLHGIYAAGDTETTTSGYLEHITAQAERLVTSVTEDLNYTTPRMYRPEDDVALLLEERHVNYSPESQPFIDSKHV